MDPKLMAERIGLQATATPQEVVDKVYALVDENSELKRDKDAAVALSEKLQAKNQAMAKRDSEVKKREAELFIDTNVQKGRIRASEREEMLELYQSKPETVVKLIEKRRFDDILSREVGFSGEGDEVSALVEIERRAATLCEKDVKLTKSEAQAKVLEQDGKLAERYRLEVVAGAKGGDR